MKKTLFWAFLLIFFGTNNGFAQKNNTEEVETIKKLLQEFYVAFSSLDVSKDKNTVLKYWHPNCLRNINYMLIDGTMQNRQQDYKALSAYLDQIIHDAETHRIMTTFQLAEYHTTTVSGASAIFGYTVNYETKQDKSTMSLGKVNCIFTFRKYETEWKIIKANINWVEEKIFKGLCNCQVFKNDMIKQNYIIRLIHPQGGEKRTELLQVRFIEKNNERLAYIHDQTYKWKSDNTIMLLDDKKQEIKLVGKATSELDVVSMVILNDLYTDNCINVVMK